MRKLLTILAICLGWISCQTEDDASIVAIFASPSSYDVKSGDKMYIDLDISTLNNTIQKVEVSTFDSQNGIQNLYSDSPAIKRYKTKIVYEAPYIDADSTFVKFSINATDDQNVSSTFSFKIKVFNSIGNILTEHSSISLYSPWSNNKDAFSFRTMQPVFSTEKENADLYLIASTESESDSMPLKIGTRTNIVYTRFNSFNYASATGGSLKNIFTNSIRSSSIDNIAIDDIILFGREEKTDSTYNLTAMGVFKVMAIYDELGSNMDRMIINIKIPQKN